MESISLTCVTVYSLVSVVFLLLTWGRDAYFAVFATFVIIYSLITQWSFLYFPELSFHVMQIDFSLESLTKASVFSTLSLIAFYASFRIIYQPIAYKSVVIVSRRTKSPLLFITLSSTFALIFALGLFGLKHDLSYSNASDELVLLQLGPTYIAFTQTYKSSVFVIIILFAVIRSQLFQKTIYHYTSLILIFFLALIFLIATIKNGSRTDPLGLTIGLVSVEIYRKKTQNTGGGKQIDNFNIISYINTRNVVYLIAVFLVLLPLLDILEQFRSAESSAAEVSYTSGALERFILKDYFPPFHVLIGAIEYNYVDPKSVLLSNFANALMFLKVDFLQAFVVNQWSPGTVTRTASPAFFAFTEGFIACGWFGAIYNGIVWSVGLAIWRRFSTTNSESFNVVGFAVTMALAATVTRCQSSYFIKNIYLLILPALGLYGIASGLFPSRLYGGKSQA